MEKRTAKVTYHGLVWYVEGYYTPGEKAKFYENNGDPGTPGTPPDLLDYCITIRQAGGESDNMADLLTLEAVETIVNRAIDDMSDPDYAEVPW